MGSTWAPGKRSTGSSSDLANAGTAVIVVSSYLPEVLRISDRILVMRDGQIALTVARAEASEEVLLNAATRGAS